MLDFVCYARMSFGVVLFCKSVHARRFLTYVKLFNVYTLPRIRRHIHGYTHSHTHPHTSAQTYAFDRYASVSTANQTLSCHQTQRREKLVTHRVNMHTSLPPTPRAYSDMPSKLKSVHE